ncbi:hypothetical protein pipiens_017340 [Culex pipiens pipiens]|uniref:Uncharacterized protein n=1 Tax=Culex pipiens pipiens TaxID=38569 RepID=A0ABD1CH93_CULPP
MSMNPNKPKNPGANQRIAPPMTTARAYVAQEEKLNHPAPGGVRDLAPINVDKLPTCRDVRRSYDHVKVVDLTLYCSNS